jgi:hypothetical protein
MIFCACLWLILHHFSKASHFGTVLQSSPGAEVIGSVADQRVFRCNVWLGFDWAYGIGGKVGTTEADSIHLRHTSKVTAV